MKPVILILSLAIGAVSLGLATSTKQSTEKQQMLAKKIQSSDDLARSDSKVSPSVVSSASQREVSAVAAASSALAPKADQKKVDQSQSAAQADAFQSVDEYVHIKPEEITVNEQNKDPLGEGAVALDVQQPQGDGAEHKSAADDELSAHLAQADTISSMESSYRPQAEISPPPVNPRIAIVGGNGYPGQQQPPPPASYPRPVQPYAPAKASARPHGSPQKGGMRLPPSYVTLKGKLIGINSLISQYPYPAPGYPHQGPRHLPRGAAAGYAAFRDFVRAHASKYKQPNGAPHYGPPPAPGPSYEPLPAVGHEEPPRAAGYGKPAAVGAYPASPAASYSGPPSSGPGHVAQTASSIGYGPAPSDAAASGYKAPRATNQKTKVTMAQAYIPHLAPANPSAGYGVNGPQQGFTNPMLAKLYGNRAPQGIGRPEYSKDYGMVIHYPQATVYTEPMTVEQLYKLTGGGISQVIEQLQYNLAHGHRDESNMIRPNNKHHIGDGITIHAKEYQAPSKNGHYVPTTAAVISTSGSYGKAGYSQQQEQPAYGAEPSYGPQEVQQSQGYGASQPETGVQLGAGYERVKQAVAAGSQTNYNNRLPDQHTAPQQDYQPAQQPQQPQQYEQSSSNRYPSGNGEPLTAITNLIGSELEALYKANAALTKHLEPEIRNHLQSYMKSSAGRQPLRYSNLSPRSPYNANQRGRGPRKGPHGPHRQPIQARPRPYGAPRPHLAGPRPHRPMPAPHRQPGGYRPRPSPQQQAYQAAEHALSQQMAQLLQDFNSGDDQYNGKGHPSRPINQGYPHKVMQKYQQQQQASAYGQLDGLEIPQGPNDQIGEIADLIEALKGSLDLHKPDAQEGGQYNGGNKQQQQQQGRLAEDVRYLASALGQVPSYAMQVPVAGEQQGYGEQSKKGAPEGAYQFQQHQQVSQQGSYQQQPEAYGHRAQQAQQLGGYGSQPAPQTGGYSGQQAGVYEGQQAQQQQQAGGQYQQVNDYQQSSGQRQPPIGHSEYSTAVQHIVNQAPAGYQAAQAAPAPSHIIPGSYVQQTEQVSAGGAYTNEHSSVINHLVPVANVASPPAAPAYSTQEHPAAAVQQPANQIAVAAPTDSQYQQAQSLSSFVDSLPNDYQELLRQPALLGSNSSTPHLAALAHETGAQDPYAHGQSSTSAQNIAQHSQEQTQQQQQQQLEGYASQQQQPTSDIHQTYQQAASSAASSTQIGHQGQFGSKQYSGVKK